MCLVLHESHHLFCHHQPCAITTLLFSPLMTLCYANFARQCPATVSNISVLFDSDSSK